MALHNKPGVSTEPRQKIPAIACELNYVPSPSRVTRSRVHYGQIAFVAISQSQDALLMAMSWADHISPACINIVLGTPDGLGFRHHLKWIPGRHLDPSAWGAAVFK